MRRRDHNRRRNAAPLGGGQRTAPDAPPKLVPLPSMLDGRSYKILDSGSPSGPAWVERAVQGRGRMQVPLGATEADRRIRLHEMAHVRWTPVNPSCEGVTHETMNACEDRRIHRRLHEVGLGGPLVSAPLWDDDGPEWQGLRDRLTAPPEHPGKLSPLDIARLLVCSDLTAESWRFRDEVADAGQGWITAVTDGLVRASGIDKRRPAWRRTVELARAIEDTFMDPPVPDDMARQAMRDYPGHEGDSGAWGEMSIETPPLPDRLPARMRATRKRYATDTGAVPRNWSRLVSDGRVFTSKRKRPGGGTVLMDLSGSMNLEAQEVMGLLAAFPGVTVATYSGRHGHGTLRIIARNGRRADEATCTQSQGGNSVDGPALDWLNEQPGPRVWVSDGYVCGADDTCNPTLVLDAASKCRAGNVKRVDKFGELLDGTGGDHA